MALRRPHEVEPEPLILADRELVEYTDEYMLHEDMLPKRHGRSTKERITGRPQPSFSVYETARFFYGKTPDWLRWRLKQGFVLDGEPYVPRTDENGYRYFSLVDVERMTHALAQANQLTGAEATTTLIIVRNVAKLYGIIR